MKILSKIKGMLIGTMALGLIFTIGTKNIYATENEIILPDDHRLQLPDSGVHRYHASLPDRLVPD